MAVLDLATYPPSVSSTVDADLGIVLDKVDTGQQYRRGLYANSYFIVSLNWDLLTLAQRNTLEGFVLLYQLDTVTFTLDGHDYTGELISGPIRRWVAGTLYGLAVQYRATRVVTP